METQDVSALQARFLRDAVPLRLNKLASRFATISTLARSDQNATSIFQLLNESRLFIDWTLSEVTQDTALQLGIIRLQVCNWIQQWSTANGDAAKLINLADDAAKWSAGVLALSALMEYAENSSAIRSTNSSNDAADPVVPIRVASGLTHDATMRSLLITLKAIRTPGVMPTESDPLGIEERGRRAIRAAKFEETPPNVWMKVLPTIPEGVTTARASELFDWAREMLIERERERGLSETAANQAATLALLTDNVY